jgi:hypothetical protein
MSGHNHPADHPGTYHGGAHPLGVIVGTPRDRAIEEVQARHPSNRPDPNQPGAGGDSLLVLYPRKVVHEYEIPMRSGLVAQGLGYDIEPRKVTFVYQGWGTVGSPCLTINVRGVRLGNEGLPDARTTVAENWLSIDSEDPLVWTLTREFVALHPEYRGLRVVVI